VSNRFKPANALRAEDWSVRPLDPMVGRALIARYHYAGGTSNTVTACHGLFHRDSRQASGVAWWIPPTKGAAQACLRGNAEMQAADVSAAHTWQSVLSLSRLVALPGLPTNAASFLMMRSAAQVSANWTVLATWADTERGHTGAIYRAANWESLGLSVPTPVWVDGNGRRVAKKAGPKTRTNAEMRELGHVFLGYFAKHRFRLIRRRFPVMHQAPQLPLFGAA
jgi:hypothetical protein